MREFVVVPLALALAACSSDSGLKKYNSEPEAFISSHTTGDTVVEGVPETIRGQVGDPNHAIEDLSVTWLLNGTETCEDSIPDEVGVVSCEMIFGTDGGEVSLEVRDPEGAGDSAAVTLEVQPTDAPVAEITAPTVDGVYYSDQLITFQGTVSDAEDAVDALTVAFETAEIGDLGFEIDTTSEGAVEAFGSLDEGEHAVRLRVTDTTGKEGVDSAVITVGPPNSNPTCAITAPVTGSAGAEGELLTFSGVAEDVDVDSDWLTVVWTSDKDGPIGTSTPNSSGTVTFPYSDLTANTHVITMTVSDEIGATCSADTVFTVGTVPVLSVTAPADGEILNHSDAVVFEATVEDNEDLANEVSLSWESDIDGVFSTEGSDSSGAVTVSIDSLSAGDHVVTVTATDTDGLFVTDTVSFNLNEPPTAPTVTLEPSPATTNQMLVATASGSVDPEGTGTVTYAYEWFEDGVPSPESSSATFAAAATGKHHTYRVQVTASDGLVESAFGYAEANVINSDPVLSGPTLSAATAVVGDVLTCTASATDIDPEDSPTVTYAWSDDSTGPTYTVTMSDAVDSAVTCTATADDADGGIVTGTASATVTNSAPVIDAVAVTPLEGQVGDVLTCTATASDPDGETPTITYGWSDGGELIATGSLYTISTGHAVDSEIVCTATATDMYGLTGTDTASATVTNTAPTMTGVTISPDPAYNDDNIVCTATATDPDGGSPAITYGWTGGATGAELPLTSIIAASGDTLTCTATAEDLYGDTAMGTASITLGNRSPSVSVSLSPAAPTKHDTLTCTASGITDPDYDSTTLTFTWTVGGSPMPASSTPGTISTLAAVFLAGQTVACRADIDDGKGGTGTDTASTEIVNSAPEVTSVTLTPSELYTNDTVTAMTSTTDSDGDELTITYAFIVDDDTVQNGSSNTLDGAVYFNKGQTVSVTVTADDTTGTGSLSSDSVAVLNSVPTEPTVSIDSSSGLTCIIDEESTDADGDPVTYTFDWDVDDTPYTDTDTTTHDGDTVPNDALGAGETWTCEVTPNDGEESGDSASDSYETDEAPPTCISVELNGTPSQYLTVPQSSDFDLDPISGSTIEGWIYNTTKSSKGYILESRGFDGWGNAHWNVRSSSSYIEFGYDTYESGSQEMGTFYSYAEEEAEWTHFAMVRSISFTDGAWYNKVFINGVESTSPHRIPSVGPSVIPNMHDIYMGKWLGGDGFFDGRYYQIRISDAAVYSTDFTPGSWLEADGDTVALWNFTAGSGSTVLDASGNGHDATLHGGSWVASCP
jgi:hypothetical protein